MSDSMSSSYSGLKITTSKSLSPNLEKALKASADRVKPDDSELSPETDLLVGYIGKAISSSVVAQLERATNVTHQYTNNPVYMNTNNLLSVYDMVLDQMRISSPAAVVGVQRTIIVDILDFVESDNTLTEHFRRNNFSLVPVRLLQVNEALITRVASTRFSDVLTMAVKSAFEQELNSIPDHRVRQMFDRQHTLYLCEHKMVMSAPVCFFHLMEQNYEFPFDKSKLDANTVPFGSKFGKLPTKAEAAKVFKHELAEFSIKCSICPRYHSFKVVR